MQQFDVPILMLVFNRASTTQIVVERLRAIQPSRIYVASDGPRAHKEGEKEKCAAVKQVFRDIDWPCEVRTLYRDENMGGPDAISQAITWFFSQEEVGIILEDDILADISFFPYCKELLHKYKDDNSVMHISGFNFDIDTSEIDESYFFSGYSAPAWGWATWKRAWDLFNWEYKDNVEQTQEKLKKTFSNKKAAKYFGKCLTRYNWDYQWMNTVVSNEGICILPRKNMILNIGFGEHATHTKDKSHPLANVNTYPNPIEIHPKQKIINSLFDDRIFNKNFNVSLLAKVKTKLRLMSKV